jgi:hypothetical protein
MRDVVTEHGHSQESAGLEMENIQIVASRADLAQQEVPLVRDIAQVAEEIGVIQDSLKRRLEARTK